MWLIKHQYYNNYCDKPIAYPYHCPSRPLPLSQGDAHGQQHQSLLAGKSNAFLSAIVPFDQSVYLLFHESVSPPSLRIRKSHGRWQAISGGAPPSSANKWDACVISWNLACILISNAVDTLHCLDVSNRYHPRIFFKVKYFTIRNSLYYSIYNCRNNKTDLWNWKCHSENLLNTKQNKSHMSQW